jgi:hypothetical protein
MKATPRSHQLAATLGLFLLLAAYPGRAAAQEVMYSDSWNDDIEENFDMPMHGVGVTEEASGYSPEQVQTTMYDNDAQALHQTQSSVDYYWVETFVFGYVRWDITTDAPMYCAETLHWRYLLDWGMELIGETASRQALARMKSKWKYNRQLPAGDYEYTKLGNNGCRNRCLNDRQCYGVQANWLAATGWLMGDTLCVLRKYASEPEPACLGPWGDLILGTTGCSS